MKTIALLAGCCLLLTACFESDSLLLDRGLTAHPFQDGTWVGDDEGATTYRLVSQGDHYQLFDGDSPQDVIMVPLEGRTRLTYAVARAEGGCADHADDCTWNYAVVEDDAGTLRETLPSCEGDYDNISDSVSGRNEDGSTCFFNQPASLMRALVYVSEHHPSGTSYTRQ